jgi:hypothetical protein
VNQKADHLGIDYNHILREHELPIEESCVENELPH